MRKFLALGLLMALFIGTASAALFESGTKDAQPMVLYGKYNNTIVPVKVAADGSVGGAQGEDSSVIFNVKTEYGAAGDGIKHIDGAITSGLTTFTSATAVFTSADVGKVITILGAAGTSVDLTSTITAFTDANTVTIADAASATVSSASFTYGTDDTAAIQSAIDAVAALDIPFGEIFFPTGIYIVNGSYTGPTIFSQLSLPRISRSGTGKPATTIIMSGPSSPGAQGAGDVYGAGGAVIYSTKYGSGAGYTIMGSYSSDAADPGNCSQMRLVLKNLTFRTVQNPTNSALYLKYVQNVYAYDLVIDTAGIINDNMPQPTTTTSYGLYLPRNQNGIGAVAENVTVRGFYNGIALDEHAHVQNSIIFYAMKGLAIFGINIGHAKYIDHVTIERTVIPLFFEPGGENYVNFTGVEIEHNCQGVGSWSCTTYDVDDASNTATGFVQYSIVNIDGNSTLTTNGGLRLDYRGIGMTNASLLNNIGNGTNQKVGIGLGSTPPTAKLQVHQSDTTAYSATALSNANIGVGNTDATNNNMTQFNFLTQNSSSAITSVIRTGAKNTVHTAGSESADYFINTKNAGTLRNSFYITSAGNVGISNSAPSGMLVVNPPAAQTIAAGDTIAHDSCGTAKLISADGAVSTSLSATFTAPAAGNEGCCMDVINVGAQPITLDNNADFLSAGGADVVLGANDTARVCSTGASGHWYQIGATGNN